MPHLYRCRHTIAIYDVQTTKTTNNIILNVEQVQQTGTANVEQ